jgi:hypothetical protein
LVAILYPGYHGNGRHFEFVQPPLQKLPHTTVDISTMWIIIWLPNHEYQFPTSKSTWKPNFSQIGGFFYFGGHFGFKMATIANHRWISICNIIIYLETKFRPKRRNFVPWIPWQRPPFWIFSTPPKAATHYGGYSYKVSWKESKSFFKSPLFCFHGNCGKICSTDSDVDVVPIKLHQFLVGE